jgi:hypothetical protein
VEERCTDKVRGHSRESSEIVHLGPPTWQDSYTTSSRITIVITCSKCGVRYVEMTTQSPTLGFANTFQRSGDIEHQQASGEQRVCTDI